MNSRLVSSLAGFFFLLLSASAVMSQGIVDLRVHGEHFRPHPHPTRRPVLKPLVVENQRIDVSIDAGVATTRVEQTFHNPNGVGLEGTYLFPIPESASVTKFSMTVDGKTMEGELMSKEDARRIYEGIVRRRRDPALLEYFGYGLFKARVFPIPARGKVSVSLAYVELLRRDGNLVEYTFPLRGRAFSEQRTKRVTLTARILATRPIGTVFSSSHTVEQRRKNDREVVVSLEGGPSLTTRDFHLFHALNGDPLGMELLSEHTVRDGGFFLLTLAPRRNVSKEIVVAKDIVFVLDTSGSMRDDQKIEQAKAALINGLKGLRPVDRFNIVTFAAQSRPFSERLMKADKEAVAEAVRWVGEISAKGGTNIQAALRDAIHYLPLSDVKERVPLIVFVTDGLPTVGETNTKPLLDFIVAENKVGARIYTLGVGFDVNVQLLDLLTKKSRGIRDYVTPGQNLEMKLSSFYEKVAHPVLADVELTIEGVKVYEVYPRSLPDLFVGDRLFVSGRYEGSGTAVVRLTGRVGAQTKEFVFETRFVDESKGRDFVPVLWARRKVADLWDTIQLEGAKTELVDEVKRLGLKYGIATPYTSFLVAEDEVAQRDGSGGLRPPGRNAGTVRRRDRFTRGNSPTSGGGFLGVPPPATQGRDAVLRSLEMKKMAEAAPAELAKDDEEVFLIDAEDGSRPDGSLARIGTMTFEKKGKVWVDTAISSKRPEDLPKLEKVELFSDVWFDLLAQHPELGPVAARLGAFEVLIGNRRIRVEAPAPKPAPTPPPPGK